MLGYWLIGVNGMGIWIGGLVVLLSALTGYAQDRGLWQPAAARGPRPDADDDRHDRAVARDAAHLPAPGRRADRARGAGEPSVTEIGPVTITNQSLVAMAISIVVLCRRRLRAPADQDRAATRAVSDNPALASASGIDTDKVIRLVWTVAMGLAGLSGLLYALVTNGIKWDSGMQIPLLFAAVTSAASARPSGALIGALIIGLVVELVAGVRDAGDFWHATALLILILLLLVRPQGLLGKPQRVG